MVIRHQIGSTTVVKPGVYGSLQVIGSYANVSPSPRNILIVGEATEGAPASSIDMKRNFFTDIDEVSEVYGSGPIVDACVQLFSNQPDRAFTGTVGRVYIAKTNQSVQASKAIAGGYATLKSARYGEVGNGIKSQIVEGTAEALPTATFTWLPDTGATLIDVAVNGVQVLDDVSLNVSDVAASVALLDAAVGADVTCTQTTVVEALDEVAITHTGDVITLTSSDFVALPSVGDSLHIPSTSTFVGASDENIGSYIVTEVLAGSIKARKVISFDGVGDLSNYIEPADVSLTAAVGVNDLIFITPMDVDVTAVANGGASLEIAANGGSLQGAGFLFNNNAKLPLSTTAANVGSIKATFASNKLTVQLVDTTWTTRPTKGSIVEIKQDSLIAGSTKKNVGLWTVSKVATSYIELTSLFSLTGETVSQVFLNGQDDVFEWHLTNTSTTVDGKVVVSAEEATVVFEAQNTFEGTVFSDEEIGGDVVLSISYYDGVASEAKVSIDNKRRMIFEFDAGSGLSDITIKMAQFPTIEKLANYIDTLNGFKAEANKVFAKNPTTILDEAQDVGILALHSGHVGNSGRLKADYWAFQSAFEGSSIDFTEGSAVYKSGLPAVEASATFFTGGVLGSTSNSNISAALEDSVKLPVRLVIPLFSRDAIRDIEDGITDEGSDYEIEGIVTLVSNHVSTSSNIRNRKYRLGLCSFYGSYEDSKELARSVGNHLISMAFMQQRALNASGEIQWMLPWVSQCMVAAGRAQSVLGTPMLNKTFSITETRHIGDLSLYEPDETPNEFDWQDLTDVEDAITAGLLVFGEVDGKSGIAMISPDLSVISEVNSSTSFYYERHNVVFIAHELLQTCQEVCSPFIGDRTSDSSVETVRSALESALSGSFVSTGAIIAYKIDKVEQLGNGYKVQLRFKPSEAIEFIGIDTIVTREL